MPSTIARTYGKKPPPKRKSSPSDNESENAAPLKRRRVTPEEQEASLSTPCPAKPPSPPAHSSSTGTPTKLTKRMLGRSRTESSIESQSTATSAAARTLSMPLIPASPPEGHSHERRPAISAATTPRVKRTYAGQSRSFLISLPVADLGPDAAHRAEEEFFEPESYSSLRQRWGVDNSEDDPLLLPSMSPSRSKSNSNNSTPRKGKAKPKAPTVYLPPNMMNPLKSITELRNKGESRRFLDEVGYLFEGMDPSSTTGLKRSSASEITAKLCDEEFARKAKAADFYHKTWDVFLKAGAGRGEDKVLDILLVFLVALIARNRDALIELARQEISRDTPVTKSPTVKSKGKAKEDDPDALVGILFFILKNSADVDPLRMISPLHSASDMEFKQIGLSKKDKIMLSSIYSTISTKSNIFPQDTLITTTLLTTHILHSLPPSYIPQTHITDLLHSLRSLLNTSFSPNQPFDGAYPEDSDREPQCECIENHLHLLDMYLLNQWALEDDDGSIKQHGLEELRIARDEWLVDGLVAIAICTEIKLSEDNGGDQASECLEVLLRVLINLTHHDEDWARRVINNEFAVLFVIRLLATSSLSYTRIGDDEDVKPKPEDDEILIVDPTNTTTKSTRTLDRLCLALGLLTNLVQSAPKFKDILRQTKLSPTCSLKSASCIKKCTCPNPIDALQILVKVYEAQSPPSISASGMRAGIKRESPTPPPPSAEPTTMEADAHLIKGTLAILFGLLMHSSPSNQKSILPAMHAVGSGSRGIVGDRAKLGRLVEQAKEFVAFYDAVSGGDAREDRSASEVIEILECLRDGI